MATSSSCDPSTSANDRSGRGKPICRAAVVAFLLRSCTTGEEKARTVPSGAVRKKFEMMRRLDGSVLVLINKHKHRVRMVASTWCVSMRNLHVYCISVVVICCTCEGHVPVGGPEGVWRVHRRVLLVEKPGPPRRRGRWNIIQWMRRGWVNLISVLFSQML